MRLMWPTVQAIVLHIVVAVVLVWTFDVSPSVKEFDLTPVNQIEWVDIAQVAPPAPVVQPPQPRPEPVVEPDNTAAELALKQKQEEERRQREAEEARQREEERKRAEAQRARDEQARREREAEEAEKRRIEQAEQDRLQRIEDEQQRLADAREARMAELQARVAAEQAANEAAEQASQQRAAQQASELESFLAGMQRQIERQWRRPASANNDMQVMLLIKLLPTGELNDVSVLQSSGDRLFDRSAIEAVESITRFNVPKDPAMFEQNFRSLNLLFDPEDLF